MKLDSKMDKHILVEYLNEIKSAICITFQSTQRIKLLSFEVSNHFIILGTRSGGIYIFKRKPCEFLRLIPSKEGPTTHVKISKNERHLALGTSKGLVIILEDYFVDFIIRPYVSNEHQGNAITVMTWHGDELYSGDKAGKVSVCSVLSTLTQAIFQSPSSILMHLDSSIVQIDAYNNYLLISTNTRTYLCDTEKEVYKQIGKKLRNGGFGACFSGCNESDYLPKNQGLKKEFKTLEEKEHFGNDLSNNEINIYCSRPGARLWVADFEATVITTYQFRNSLNTLSTNLIRLEDNNKNEKLNISDLDQVKISNDFNFFKIYPLHPNIILTYDKKGIYFFNLETSALLCWTDVFQNINDLKILKPYIYIWCNDRQINIISLYTLEEFIITTLLNKQYFLCAEICNYFHEDVLKLVGKSKNINLMSILESKLKGMITLELQDNIKSILEKLYKYHEKEQKLGIKLENGIVMVNNKNLCEKKENVQNQISNECNSLEEENLKIIYKQYVFNKVNKVAELSESSRILNSLDLNDLPSLFESFVKYVSSINEEDASVWCQEQMVKLASKYSKNIDHLDASTIFFLSRTFLDLNKFQMDTCKCKFPLPKAHMRKIQYFDLCCKLYDLSEDKNEYLYNIPCLYKYKISGLLEKTPCLSLIIQFSDKELIRDCLEEFTYDIWDEILKIFIKLQKNQCLNCNQKISGVGMLTWTEISTFMLESIGAKNATKLLRRYAQFIPKGMLDVFFYQSCIFSLTCEDRGLAVKCIENTKSGGNSKKFDEYLEQFLQKKYLGNESQPKDTNSTLICSYCQLPINNPVLVDSKRCLCGGYYHHICFVNSNFCKFCVNLSKS